MRYLTPTPLLLEIFGYDFKNIQNKPEFLSDRIISYILSGHLTHKQRLPSIKVVRELTNLSIDTILKAWDILRAKSYIITVPGSNSSINSPGCAITPVVVPEIHMFLNHFCIPSKASYAQLDKKIQTTKAKINYGIYHREHYDIDYEFLHMIFNRLNHHYGTTYRESNVYYMKRYFYTFWIIGLVIYQEGGVIVVPEHVYFEVRQAFTTANIRLLSVQFDKDGINTDQLAAICKSEKVIGVFTSSNASFPAAIFTSIDRVKRVLELQRNYGFTIIEADTIGDWQATKSNFYLQLADIKTDALIYIRPSSNLSIEFNHIIEVFSTTEIIHKIRCEAQERGSYNKRLVSASAVKLLGSALFRKATSEVLTRSVSLSQIVTGVFTDSGFWEPNGISERAWPGIFLVPLFGAFPDDAFEQLKEVGILVVNPAEYVFNSTSIPGIRIDLANYLIKNNTMKTELAKLEKICRRMCQANN